MSTQKHESAKESDSFTAEELIRLKAVARRHESFWRNYPFLVSLIGLCLSLVTAITSAYIAHRKDIHDQQAELATAIHSIQDLRLKQVEIRDKYKGSPYEQTAGGLIGNEIYALTLSAADLIIQLGTNAPTAVIIPISDAVYYNVFIRKLRS